MFTDAEGNERRADAVLSVMTEDGQRVIFLIEHKSTQDKGLGARKRAESLHEQSEVDSC